MAKLPTLIDITAGHGSNTQHNANNDAIETAFTNTLSRDGSAPNQMEADFDLNSNDLLNGGTLNADDIVIGGVSIQDLVDAAAASAAAAAASEANVENLYDQFDDLFLGRKASAPTLDNDGNALQKGAIYYNTTTDQLYVWNGSSWVALGGVSTFLGLSDTPSSYSGSALKVARVNAGETAIEFVTISTSEPSDGDKGDITVSGSGLVWNLDAGVVDSAEIAAGAVDNSHLSGSITIDKIETTDKTGIDGKLVTGTAGASGKIAQWNADGDVITNGYGILDEDDMASNSATNVPTQQSVKAYVDSIAGTQKINARHAVSSGTDGGTFTSGAWRVRTLTNFTNNITGASVASNQVTLPDGTYNVEGWAVGYFCGSHQSALYNVTDATTVMTGASVYAGEGSPESRFSNIITVSGGPKVYELRHRCSSTKSTNGLGLACGFGVNEVYAQLLIVKIG